MRQLPPNDASAPPSGQVSALDSLLRVAARALGGAACALVRIEPGEGRTTACDVLAVHGIDVMAAEAGTEFYVRARRAGHPVVHPSGWDGANGGPLLHAPPEWRTAIAVPVSGCDRRPTSTILAVFDRSRDFTAPDGELLAEFSPLIEAELARREADGGYRSIFENAVEGIYQSLPNSGFVTVNPALARLLGYDSPKAMLESLVDPSRLYVQPGRREEFEARIRAEGELAGWESEVYHADGRRLWISEHARAICDEGGRVLRYEGTFEDITSRKHAEESLQRAHDELEDRIRDRTAELAMLNTTLRQHILEREVAEAAARRSESKFRALIENAQDLISVLTPDGISLYQSPSMEHLLGYSPDELIGSNIFTDLMHPDDYPAVQRAAEAIVDGGERYVRVEARCRHQDGSWRLLECVGSSAPPDSPVVGVVFNSRDITGRRQVELEHEARTREQTAVAELGRFALDERDLGDILDRTAELVARALDVPFAVVSELQPDGETLVMRSGVGWGEGVIGRICPSAEFFHLGEDGQPANGGLIRIGDLATDGQFVCRLDPPEGMAPPRSGISVVIHCDGRPFGSLSALSPEPYRFDERDALFLQTVADLLSAVIASDRHRAASREVQARYERIAANTPGMVYQALRRMDGTASVFFVSEGCRQVYGLEATQIIAQPELMNTMIHPDDRPRVMAQLAQSNITLATLQWEGRVVHPSGEVRWITARSRPERLANGDIYRDGIIFDVTELKHAQEDMRAAKEEAETANRAKSEFLSRISHELRTPLNAILGFGQLLGLEQLTPVQNSSLEQILKGGRHLLDLINEVLDITRIEAGRIEMFIEPTDVAMVVNEALHFVRPLGEQYHVQFQTPQTEGCPAVLADRSRLHQVFLNLLSNAVKYNREDGEVRVVCGRRGKDTVRLSISDTGCGLTSAELGQLFTPFQRLGAPQRGIAGTGIGLTISRSLVEAMGGEITVESSPDVGSTFHIDLPAAPADAPVAPTPSLAAGDIVPELPQEPVSATVRTLLLIDDQAANVSLVERVLETRENLRLFTANDGRGGLTLARRQPPDLILLDLHLPDMGGEEVMRRLRLEPKTRNVPVIILSADATPAQVARLRHFGAHEYLTKPFRIRELLAAIDTVFAPSTAPA